MSKYKINFVTLGKFKDRLHTLSEQDLDTMQIGKAGERLKILKAVKTLNGGETVQTEVKPTIESKPTDNVPAPQPQAEKGHSSLEEELDHMKYVSKKKSDWRIPHSSLEFLVKLGSGASGTVYKGIYEGMNVAIKLLKTNSSVKEVEEFKKEFHIMRF